MQRKNFETRGNKPSHRDSYMDCESDTARIGAEFSEMTTDLLLFPFRDDK